MRVGVEVGGTFTDLVAFGDNGIRVTKVPSTPQAPDEGAMNAIDAAHLALGDVEDLVHGSTVATNAILERKGARVCLLVTRGTRDILYLQRHDRRAIYDLYYRKPVPIVARRDTFEIAERIDANGDIVEPMDRAAAIETIDHALGNGTYDAVAVCFLSSYCNPTHERAVAELITQRYPALSITCSVDVCREFREYERCSTTALAAFVKPVIDGYLRRFSSALAGQGYRNRFSVMQSNGGRLPASAMGENAITSLFSGPAAGVTGALRQASRSGFSDLITLDMGGTSTDVCLIENGKPLLSGSTQIDGLPIKTPVIDIATVGAGGGSIVWIDDGDLMRVGPQSAGANPGPACYGRDGKIPTITDAHLLRGTVRSESFLDGQMRLDVDRAREAFTTVAEHLGLSIEEAADSAIRIAESNIVRAIQQISTEKGKDPRDYVLVAFGGAGPMQCAKVAEELGIGTVVVPPHAGVLSAYGLLASDFVYYATRTARMTVNEAHMSDLRQTLADLRDEVTHYLDTLGLEGHPVFTYSLDMRYVSQAFEIAVELDGSIVDSLDASALARQFDQAHNAVFEFDEGGNRAVEVVSFRVGAAVSPGPIPTLSAKPDHPTAGEIEIFQDSAWGQCANVNRSHLQHLRDRLEGPALVEDGTSTLFIPPGWAARVDDAHNVLLEQTTSRK